MEEALFLAKEYGYFTRKEVQLHIVKPTAATRERRIGGIEGGRKLGTAPFGSKTESNTRCSSPPSVQDTFVLISPLSMESGKGFAGLGEVAVLLAGRLAVPARELPRPAPGPRERPGG